MKLGPKIDEGAKRAAYVHPENSKWVIKKYKKEGLEGCGQIGYEIQVWKLANILGVEKYLVPIVDYGEDWLIMERAEPLPKGIRIPRKKWMHDTKLPNWGLHDGKPKMLDYGSKAMMKRLKKIKDLGTFIEK